MAPASVLFPEKEAYVPALVLEREAYVPALVLEREAYVPALVPVSEKEACAPAPERGVLEVQAVRNHRSCTLCACEKEIVTR